MDRAERICRALLYVRPSQLRCYSPSRGEYDACIGNDLFLSRDIPPNTHIVYFVIAIQMMEKTGIELLNFSEIGHNIIKMSCNSVSQIRIRQCCILFGMPFSFTGLSLTASLVSFFVFKALTAITQKASKR